MSNASEEMEPMDLDELAHYLWAAAQLGPREGITDAIDRIKSILTSAEVAK